LTRPIDTYFRKMEDCQKLADDDEVPISEAEMVLQLQTHIGATGLVNSRYLKWKKKPLASRTWPLAKTEFRDALSDVGVINKLTTAEAGLTANSAVNRRKTTEASVRAEMQRDLGESFDTLACAATIKSDTMDALSKSLSEVTAANGKLASANADLTATIVRLTNQLSSALGRSNSNNNNNTNNNSSNSNTTRNRSRTRNNNNNNNNSGNSDEWPAWCDPDAYCHTCGYKVRKGHDSGTCPKAKDNADHKSGATRQNTMGGSKLHAGFGNQPNGK
jgi:hypothetical protein